MQQQSFQQLFVQMKSCQQINMKISILIFTQHSEFNIKSFLKKKQITWKSFFYPGNLFVDKIRNLLWFVCKLSEKTKYSQWQTESEYWSFLSFINKYY